MPDSPETRLARALLSLDGLSVGDAFGERFFVEPSEAEDAIEKRILPPAPWRWTDDTQMALSIVSNLRQYDGVNQEMLAFSFGARYETGRGYGPAMHWLLPRLNGASASWSQLSHSLFNGQGSFGNGGAMRIAPLGAYFADDLETAKEQPYVIRKATTHPLETAKTQAFLATEVTHAHPEAVAGAIAVAVAAAQASRLHGNAKPTRAEFIDGILPFVPNGRVSEKIRHARDLDATASVRLAVAALGSGNEIAAHDTVPFVLWCAGEHLDNYEDALWLTVSGLGDRDTTCAMVGGIVALSAGSVPADWLAAREPLPRWPTVEQIEW